MAEISSIGDNMTPTSFYKDATWIRMMAETFKAADEQSAPLDANGPWTVHTRNIQEYVQHAKFIAYA
jgi:hypothetical protein